MPKIIRFEISSRKFISWLNGVTSLNKLNYWIFHQEMERCCQQIGDSQQWSIGKCTIFKFAWTLSFSIVRWNHRHQTSRWSIVCCTTNGLQNVIILQYTKLDGKFPIEMYEPFDFELSQLHNDWQSIEPFLATTWPIIVENCDLSWIAESISKHFWWDSQSNACSRWTRMELFRKVCFWTIESISWSIIESKFLVLYFSKFTMRSPHNLFSTHFTHTTATKYHWNG